MASEPEILLADDDDVGRYVVATMLQRAGFAVRGVADGVQAVEEALRQPPDLVVLDVKMPHLNGFEACRRLKADPRTEHVPVLLLSATFLQTEYQVEGLEGGADAYLTQPVEAPVLAATVRALIRARRAETAVRDAARQWHATFDAIDDGVALLDAEGILRQANAALGRLVGSEAGALVGRAVAQALPGLAASVATLAAPGGPRELEVAADGLVLRLRAAPLDPGGGPEDARLAVMVSDVTAAHEVERERSLRLEREREVSRTLQQALLPERLPRRPGVLVAAWHEAAQADLVIGGDWYDAIDSSQGLWLVMGDVAGHGVQAAAQAGQLRHSLRVYAHEGASPAVAMRALNELVHDAGPPDFATVCVVALDPDGRGAEVVCAGHPPPVLTRRGEAPRMLEVGRNPVLGVPGTTFVAERVALVEGDRVLLYTDGLVERPGEPLELGLQRLLGWVAASDGLVELNDALRALTLDDGGLRDDVAVLAAELGAAG